MKKLSTMLLIVLSVLIVSSCAAPEQPEAFEMEYGQTLSRDFEGYKLTIRGGYYPEINQSVIGDAVRARYDAVAAEYDIEFDMQETVFADYTSALMTHLAGGTKYADVMSSWIEHMFGAYRSNMVYPISGNGVFDPEQEKYGTELALNAVRFDGENIYGIQANVWPEKTSNIFNFVLFNHQLMNEYNFTSPYELLENGSWTWDVFREMANACTNSSEERWGISTEHDEFPLCAIFSNNGKLLTQDSTGRYIWGYTEPEVITALEWCQTLALEDKCVYTNPDASHPWDTMWAFSEGRTAFHVGPSYFGLGTATGAADDQMYPLVGLPSTGFGWVPFPFGPDNTEQTWNIQYDHMEGYYNIPNDPSIELDAVFFIIDKLFEPIEEVPTWKEYYERYLFTESTGFSTYIKMLESASVSYLHIWGSNRATMVSLLGDMMRRKMSVSQQINSLRDTMQSVVDEIYNN